MAGSSVLKKFEDALAQVRPLGVEHLIERLC